MSSMPLKSFMRVTSVLEYFSLKSLSVTAGNLIFIGIKVDRKFVRF